MAVSARLASTVSERKQVHFHLSDVCGVALLGALCAIAIVALVLPSIVVIAMSFDDALHVRFPPEAFSSVQYLRVSENADLIDAAKLSLSVAALVVAIDLLLGIPASISLARSEFRGTSLLIGFLQSPLTIPGIVVGISILFFVSFAKIQVSVPLMILSHVVVTIPFVVRITLARMETAEKTLEDAARNLRANQWQVFRHIQLPYLMPGIVGGGAFAFLSSFDNLPVSLFTSPPLYPPLPIYIFRIMMYKIDPMIAAVATIQIMITFLVMVVATRTVGALQFVGGD